MNQEKRVNLYTAVIAKKGVEHQKWKAIEEFSELITELAREKNGNGNKLKIVDELADAFIMCEQLFVIEGFGEVRGIHNYNGDEIGINPLLDVMIQISTSKKVDFNDLRLVFSCLCQMKSGIDICVDEKIKHKLNRLKKRLKKNKL